MMPSQAFTIFLTSDWSNTSNRLDTPCRIPDTHRGRGRGSVRVRRRIMCVHQTRKTLPIRTHYNSVSLSCVRFTHCFLVKQHFMYWHIHVPLHVPLAPSNRSTWWAWLDWSTLSPSDASTSLLLASSTITKVGGISFLRISSLLVSTVCFPTWVGEYEEGSRLKWHCMCVCACVHACVWITHIMEPL